MILRRLALFSLLAALVAPPSAFAQDDDLIAPLGPQPTKPSRSKKSKTTKAPKPPKRRVTKKERTTSRKGQPVKPVKPSADDDLIAPLEPAKTELALKLGGNARGAKVQVDGKDVAPGSGPLTVTPGEHTVVARRSGYAEFNERIVVEEGKSAELVVALEPVVGFATLTADVGRATVVVDGVELGTTPLTNVQLKPGTREVEFRAKGLKDVQRINVRPGQQYVVEGKLRPAESVRVASSDQPRNPVLTPESTPVDQPGLSLTPEPEPQVTASTSKAWYQRWYVWAGVGAVVAAASVGAVVATRNNAGVALTLNDVCGPSGCDTTINPPKGATSVSAGGIRFATPGGLRF